MRRVRHSKSGLFLIELMICILFFSFTAGICIRFFAKSHTLSQDAKNLYQAQQEASSMAEILEKDIDSLDHIYVYYDKDWKQCDKEDRVYWLEVTEQESGQMKQGKGKGTEGSENIDNTENTGSFEEKDNTKSTGSSEEKDNTKSTGSSKEKTSTDNTESTSAKQTNLKKIKIAVYSGTESKKSEIYHLNLSIYVPQGGGTQKDSIQIKHSAAVQKEGTAL